MRTTAGHNGFPEPGNVTLALGRPSDSARVCLIDGWRDLEPDRPQVCARCQSRMDRQLDLLSRVAKILPVVAMSEPTARGELNLVVVDLALPGNPAVFGATEDQIGMPPIAARLARWAEKWSNRDLWSVDAYSAASFLRRCLRWACVSAPDVVDFASELRRTYAEARTAIGRNLSPRRFDVPCPHCGQKTLRRMVGADWVECPPCEALWDDQDIPELAATALRRTIPAGQPLSTSEVAVLAGVSLDVVWQWRHRGKITPDVGPWGGIRFLRIDVDWCQAHIEHRQRSLKPKREMVAA